MSWWNPWKRIRELEHELKSMQTWVDILRIELHRAKADRIHRDPKTGRFTK